MIFFECVCAEATHFQWPVTRQKTLIISNLHFNKKRRSGSLRQRRSDPKNRWDWSWHSASSDSERKSTPRDEVPSPNIMTLLSHPGRANASMPLKNAQKLRQIERQLFFFRSGCLQLAVKKLAPNKIQLTNSFLTWKIQFKSRGADLTLLARPTLPKIEIVSAGIWFWAF